MILPVAETPLNTLLLTGPSAMFVFPEEWHEIVPLLLDSLLNE